MKLTGFERRKEIKKWGKEENNEGGEKRKKKKFASWFSYEIFFLTSFGNFKKIGFNHEIIISIKNGFGLAKLYSYIYKINMTYLAASSHKI